MDPNVLRGKVIEKGLMDADSAARLTDRNATNLIFMRASPPTSEISDVSAAASVWTWSRRASRAQRHCRYRFRQGPRHHHHHQPVPLTAGHMPTLMVKLNSRTFALRCPASARSSRSIRGAPIISMDNWW